MAPEPSCSKQPLPPFPPEGYYCVRDHTRISKKVMAALNSRAPMYELHVICGVNDKVLGPLFCPGGSKFAPHKCYRCHVNFLATLKGAREAPVLFFAELSNDDEDEGGTCYMCCPVSAPPPSAGIYVLTIIVFLFITNSQV